MNGTSFRQRDIFYRGQVARIFSLQTIECNPVIEIQIVPGALLGETIPLLLHQIKKYFKLMKQYLETKTDNELFTPVQ